MKYYCLKEFDGMKNLEVYMSYKRSIIIADENLNLDLIKFWDRLIVKFRHPSGLYLIVFIFQGFLKIFISLFFITRINKLATFLLF
jgi:hypothetical protein